MEHNIINQNKGDDILGETGVQSTNRNYDLAFEIITLGQRFENLVSDSQLYMSRGGVVFFKGSGTMRSFLNFGNSL